MIEGFDPIIMTGISILAFVIIAFILGLWPRPRRNRNKEEP